MLHRTSFQSVYRKARTVYANSARPLAARLIETNHPTLAALYNSWIILQLQKLEVMRGRTTLRPLHLHIRFHWPLSFSTTFPPAHALCNPSLPGADKNQVAFPSLNSSAGISYLNGTVWKINANFLEETSINSIKQECSCRSEFGNAYSCWKNIYAHWAVWH